MLRYVLPRTVYHYFSDRLEKPTLPQGPIYLDPNDYNPFPDRLVILDCIRGDRHGIPSFMPLLD